MLALLIWAFAAYGIVAALYQVVRLYESPSISEGHRFTLVLVVRNGEAYVEGLLRFLLVRSFFLKNDLHILVVDTGSEDSTREIVSRLQENYSRIELIGTDREYDGGLLESVWSSADQDSPFALYDLRSWKNTKRIIPYFKRVFG
ncbi:glycosyltransferase [Effusibacillus dendaii]|uniref:Glycosyltransferase 2-like domain-containing protein n=1 Tax=Effusibacillus dendaii TaxID=2743772 RepID=A0A7I8DCN0_9BACL|nr:glycosyltransferase [Effusibacillus dendaii]BCJ87844.1 hypothetical protein skT53_28290 [Effusibacillus dendaii]